MVPAAKAPGSGSQGAGARKAASSGPSTSGSRSWACPSRMRARPSGRAAASARAAAHEQRAGPAGDHERGDGHGAGQVRRHGAVAQDGGLVDEGLGHRFEGGTERRLAQPGDDLGGDADQLRLEVLDGVAAPAGAISAARARRVVDGRPAAGRWRRTAGRTARAW